MKLPTKTTVNFDELFIMFSNTNRTQQQLLVQETFYALKMYIKNNGINNESSKQEVKIRDSEHGLQFLSFISSPFHEIAQEIDRGKLRSSIRSWNYYYYCCWRNPKCQSMYLFSISLSLKSYKMLHNLATNTIVFFY